MATTDRPGNAGSGAGGGDASPVTPPWQKIALLLFRAECLAGEAALAIKGGDHATAARMYVEMQAAIHESIEIAERMRAL